MPSYLALHRTVLLNILALIAKDVTRCNCVSYFSCPEHVSHFEMLILVMPQIA